MTRAEIDRDYKMVPVRVEPDNCRGCAFYGTIDEPMKEGCMLMRGDCFDLKNKIDYILVKR